MFPSPFEFLCRPQFLIMRCHVGCLGNVDAIKLDKTADQHVTLAIDSLKYGWQTCQLIFTSLLLILLHVFLNFIILMWRREKML